MSLKIKFVQEMSWDARKKILQNHASWAFKSALKGWSKIEPSLKQDEQQAWKAIVIEK